MSLEPLNILLADDDIDDCGFFKEAVFELPFAANLTEVHDGEQLMRLLNDEKNEVPHILFLDLNMPRKNGFECLAEIKLNDRLRHLVVILFSTSFDQGVVDRLFANGAQHFIRKPSEFMQFKKIIQKTLTQETMKNIPKLTRDTFVITA